MTTPRSPLFAFAAALALGAALAGCGTQPPEGASSMNTVQPFETTATAQDWQTLSQMKVAFGHQSVGGEVLKGMEALAQENNAALSVTESKAPFSAPALHHFKIGRNEAPDSKLADFTQAMTEVDGSADVALMKLCYIDFNSGTNPAQLAQAYIAEVDKLAAQYPNTTFVAVTAPLTTVQTGPKALLKKLMGKLPGGYEANAQRKVFNDALRQRYAGGTQLFDIAAVESGFGAVSVEHKGQRIEGLDPALTYDGGHLNEQGQRAIGGALAHHLARIGQSRSAQ